MRRRAGRRRLRLGFLNQWLSRCWFRGCPVGKGSDGTPSLRAGGRSCPRFEPREIAKSHAPDGDKQQQQHELDWPVLHLPVFPTRGLGGRSLVKGGRAVNPVVLLWLPDAFPPRQTLPAPPRIPIHTLSGSRVSSALVVRMPVEFAHGRLLSEKVESGQNHSRPRADAESIIARGAQDHAPFTGNPRLCTMSRRLARLFLAAS